MVMHTFHLVSLSLLERSVRVMHTFDLVSPSLLERSARVMHTFDLVSLSLSPGEECEGNAYF